MHTLGSQVKLRRLIRAFGEAVDRLGSQPPERGLAGLVVDRLLELAGEVRESWRRESLRRPVEPALERYVRDALKTAELASAGLQQAGADLELLRRDFESAALPLEVFLRGLDAEPALERLRSQAQPRLAEGADQPPQLDLGRQRTHVWNQL